VAGLGIGHQRSEQLERGRIRPLQIVQEHCHQVVRSREDANEPTKQTVEEITFFRRRQRLDDWLGADDQLDLRNNVGDHPAVSAERVAEASSPQLELLFAAGQ